MTPARVGLQGIHDAQRRIVAYELLFRAPGATSASLHGVEENDRATAQVITSTFGEFGAQEIADGNVLFLNTTRAFFTGHLPLPFPPEGVVLELLENVEVDAELVAGLQDLSARGYVLAVDDFDGELWRLPALPLATYVKIDIEVTADRLAQVVDLVREVNPAASIVVERVETEEQFERCLALGADLFQGYHLHRPVTVQRRTLTATHLVCVQLLAALSRADARTEDVMELLAHDPALSMRVLKTASSAAYAPRAGISSLQQAVVMLGRRELGSWVALLLLGGDAGNDTDDRPDLVGVLTRAAACRALVPGDGDTAFTVGLLSGAADVLGVSPGDLLRGCVVSPVVRQALVEGTGEIGHALAAVTAHEELFSCAPGADHPGLDLPDVSTTYLRALQTARGVMARMVSAPG